VGKKVKMGYFGNNWRNWGPPRGRGITPSVSIIFPILNLAKSAIISVLGVHLTLMTSDAKVKMGYFGNKLRNWGPPRGPGISPSLSIIFPILNIAKPDVISLLKAH
jgi:hypothetical protein